MPVLTGARGALAQEGQLTLWIVELFDSFDQDRHQDPPLVSAVQAGSLAVIRLLRQVLGSLNTCSSWCDRCSRQVGAHLPLPPLQQGERLTAAARAGRAPLLRCWLAAGCNPAQPDLAGQTAHQAATAAGHTELATEISALVHSAANRGSGHNIP